MKVGRISFMLILLCFFMIAGCSAVPEPPEAIVKVGDDKLNAVKGTYQWIQKGFSSDTSVNADAPSPFQLGEDMEPSSIKKGAEAKVEFHDGTHPKLQAFLWLDEGRRQQVPMKDERLTFPSEPGRYVIEIWAAWPNGDASYTILAEIQ
jgi:hypothetical protein